MPNSLSDKWGTCFSGDIKLVFPKDLLIWKMRGIERRFKMVPECRGMPYFHRKETLCEAGMQTATHQ